MSPFNPTDGKTHEIHNMKNQRNLGEKQKADIPR